MTMKTIHLDISSDIFDKVVSFLQMLPQNKIHLKIDNNENKEKKEEDFNPRDYFAVASSSKSDIDTYLKESKNSWDTLRDIP